MNTASPNVIASSGVPAFAFGPSSETIAARVSGWREANITSWPSLTQRVPIVPPIFPAPITPIRIFFAPSWARAGRAATRDRPAAKASAARRVVRSDRIDEGLHLLALCRIREAAPGGTEVVLDIRGLRHPGDRAGHGRVAEHVLEEELRPAGAAEVLGDGRQFLALDRL